jgi:hypothetical protein
MRTQGDIIYICVCVCACWLHTGSDSIRAAVLLAYFLVAAPAVLVLAFAAFAADALLLEVVPAALEYGPGVYRLCAFGGRATYDCDGVEAYGLATTPCGG